MGATRPTRGLCPHRRWWCVAAHRQPRHAQQVVGSAHILARGVDTLHASVRAFAQPADALGPAEDLLDASPHDQARLIAVALRGARVESCRLPSVDLRAVRGDSALAAALHELLVVIPVDSASPSLCGQHCVQSVSLRSAVSSQCPGLEAALFEFVQCVDDGAGLPSCRRLCSQASLIRCRLRGKAFGFAHHLMHIERDAQAVAVVYAGVHSKAQLRGAAFAFAQQLRLRVGLALVRVVAALLAFDVAPAVAVAGLLRLVLGAEALPINKKPCNSLNYRALRLVAGAGFEPATFSL